MFVVVVVVVVVVVKNVYNLAGKAGHASKASVQILVISVPFNPPMFVGYFTPDSGPRSVVSKIKYPGTF